MSKEILLVVDAISNEKGVPRDVIFEAVEAALASASRKRFDQEEADIRVKIDRVTGDYATYRRWTVVEDDEFETPDYEIKASIAEQREEPLALGAVVEKQIESEAFGRIAAQTAKQVIVQKVREAERAEVVRLYAEREGELVAGIVKKTTRDGLIIDLGDNAEGFLPRGEMIHGERYRLNERVRALLWKVDADARGSQLILSRTRPELIIELFNVPVGLNVLNAGIILGLMAAPIMTSIAEDALKAVPDRYREAAEALGATRWQVIYKTVLPAAKNGLLGAVLLGVGRGFGETMAVLMATGHSVNIPHSIFDSVRALTATIAAELGETAVGSDHYQVLFTIGIFLFIITFIINLTADLVVRGVRNG